MADFGDLVVKRFEHLYRLSDAEKTVLRDMCSHTKEVSAHEDIYREGDRPGGSALLLDGFACRYKLTRSGRRQITAFIVPGDFFDIQSFLLRRLDHTVATISACTLAIVPHETVMEATRTHHGIALGLWKSSLIESAIFREWVVNVGQRNAHARIAHVMCELYERLAVIGEASGGTMPWPMTQSALGDATGLSPVHVNRTLQDLRSEGLITLEDKRLTIHDWDGLCRKGEFEGQYLHLPSAA